MYTKQKLQQNTPNLYGYASKKTFNGRGPAVYLPIIQGSKTWKKQKQNTVNREARQRGWHGMRFCILIA